MNKDTTIQQRPVGRFAPSPSGRMHLGNLYTALLSWLSVKSKGGRWILRIEDLDPQRSKYDFARLIEDDLAWLGLDFDEGGLEDRGPAEAYSQSRRGDIYNQAFKQLESTGLTYPCYCTRADVKATQAPHQSDGRIVYAGTCRPDGFPEVRPEEPTRPHATRIMVRDEEICFNDRVFGSQKVNLVDHCGDFVLRRADGAWAYQLAVVVDDALMGVTEVVRGCDLLLSSAQQIYLYRLLGFNPPQWAHLPLVRNENGLRLSKRDHSMSMDHLRDTSSPQEIIGRLAATAGIIDHSEPCTPADLLGIFSWESIRRATLQKSNH